MGRAGNLASAFEAAGQGHVFAGWDALDTAGQEHLRGQAEEIDLDELGRLVAELVTGDAPPGDGDLPGAAGEIEPAPFLPHPARGGDPDAWAQAVAAGEEALRAGRVAAFTVAGGQGTRLGFDGPKGTFPVGPVTGHVLFRFLADKIRGASERYGVALPWFIMTSRGNHEATVSHFEASGHHGLDPAQVHFFSQGRMPAVGFDGKILMASAGSIAMSPDGHGGSLRALVRSGSTERMRAAGVDTISTFQVDNPLVKAIDPAFIGFHLQAGSEMSSKTTPKAFPGEKVGHFCRRGGTTVVIEYSDMPEDLLAAADEEGNPRFNAGSIAIHILDRGFVERVGGPGEAVNLPFHRAEKKVAVAGADGHPVTPEQPNGIKFELFIFDAIPFARNPLVVETLRQDDFSPVKNAEGVDSPQTCRDDLLRQWARWLANAGAPLETDPTGLPPFPIEISPAFADDGATFLRRWGELEEKPTPGPGFTLE